MEKIPSIENNAVNIIHQNHSSLIVDIIQKEEEIPHITCLLPYFFLDWEDANPEYRLDKYNMPYTFTRFSLPEFLKTEILFLTTTLIWRANKKCVCPKVQ
jgi:hypothetical protein